MFPFLHIVTNVFDDSHPDKCEVISRDIDLHFPDD